MTARGEGLGVAAAGEAGGAGAPRDLSRQRFGAAAGAPVPLSPRRYRSTLGLQASNDYDAGPVTVFRDATAR